MLTFKQKIEYLISSTYHYFQPIHCPSCASKAATLIDRKYYVTKLLECKNCHLRFRHPLESIKSNGLFYQEEYEEADGITTVLPSEAELQQMISTSFAQHPQRCADRYIAIFEALLGNTNGATVVDYGSSWGYLSYQLKEKGMQVRSYEISRPRAHFGNRQLGLDIKTSEQELEGGNKIFFSSHVIEHLPDISSMVSLASSLTTKDGLFIALCPNGSQEFQKKSPTAFHQSWGKVHPNMLTPKYYQHLFRRNPVMVVSNPYNIEAIRAWDQNSQVVGNMDGEELMVIALLNKSLP